MNERPTHDWKESFIRTRRVARLATVDADGQPHAVPIVYAFDGNYLFTPIDEKPKRVEEYQLRRVRNIQVNPRVAVIIDEYAEDWQQLAWVQVRGRAELLTEGDRYQTGIDLLMEKYSQYADMPLAEHPVIAIAPDRTVGWRAQGD